MHLTFLSTDVPLTKTITHIPGKKPRKDPYPMRKFFTSHDVEVNNITEMFKSVQKHSLLPNKPCMLKGNIKQPLINEPRAGTTTSSDMTWNLALDLDRASFNTPDEFMNAMGLDEVSYFVQYSSSYKLDPKDKTLSCHIFIILSEPIQAPLIKAWLMYLNLTVTSLKDNLTLCEAGHALHWPLDITTCQNDKLIYIAEPTFIGMKSPIPSTERIQLVIKKNQTLTTSIIKPPQIEALKKQARTIINNLRNTADLPKLRATKIEGEYEIQTGIGEITYTPAYETEDFKYFNINGGDSNGYFHPVNNFEIMHNFKGEAFFKIKECMPVYYQECIRARNTANRAPNNDGDVPLVICDKITSEYYKLIWNPNTGELKEMNKAKTLIQLEHFMRGHGRQPEEFIPEWEVIYDPQNLTQVDLENHIINKFMPSIYMDSVNQIKGKFPAIMECLHNACGEDKDVLDNTINWIATIFQHKVKTRTTQIWHGVEGTGKGMLATYILSPLFGENNCFEIVSNLITQDFNGWMEDKLFVFIDEIDADMFTNPKSIEAKFRNWITEDKPTIRRMRTDSYSKQSYVNFAFSSNQNQPVHIPPKDRRNNVCKFNPERWLPTQHTVNIIKQGKELPAFAHFLQNYKTDIERAGAILHTDDRTAIQELGITSIDKLARDLLTGNFSGLLEAMPDEAHLHGQSDGGYIASTFITLLKRFVNEPISRLSRDDLQIIFKHCIGTTPEGAHKFTSYLKHHGIETKVLRVNNKPTRGFEITWKIEPEDRTWLLDKYPTKLKAVR